MKVCIPQILNALSLLSPVLFWIKHKKKLRDKLIHKFVIWHMPISFIYHFLQGLHCINNICHIAKTLDYVCIHTYGIICCLQKKTKSNKKIYLSILANSYCLNKIVVNHQSNKIDCATFTVVRLGALSLSGFCLACKTSMQHNAVAHGALCCCFYVLDEHLQCYGHCLFHVTLCALYDCIFNISSELLGQNSTNHSV
jgi:hypothetical protein